ncbi:MAG: hypothetical protein GC151_03300 [Betaproteobacteria bacterium]|nr:hypothetical protein [Betaproteobacteria bacterium]
MTMLKWLVIRKPKALLYFGVGLASVIYLSIYALVWNSQAYETAVQAVRDSESIRSNLGRISTIWLKPAGFRVKYSGSVGTAHFVVHVMGMSRSGEVSIDLAYEVDHWNIVQLYLDGMPIDSTGN